MATAPTASFQWIPEDDILLKNAVEVIPISNFIASLVILGSYIVAKLIFMRSLCIDAFFCC